MLLDVVDIELEAIDRRGVGKSQTTGGEVRPIDRGQKADCPGPRRERQCHAGLLASRNHSRSEGVRQGAASRKAADSGLEPIRIVAHDWLEIRIARKFRRIEILGQRRLLPYVTDDQSVVRIEQLIDGNVASGFRGIALGGVLRAAADFKLIRTSRDRGRCR